VRPLAAFAGAALLLTACQQPAPDTSAADRAAIHDLLVAYGETIDARDWDGFAALFAKDGVYAGGAGGEGLKGPEAAEALRRTFEANPSGAGEPNFHLFFSERIALTGPDSAHATSRSFWVVPGEDGGPKPLLAAAYVDDLVREDGAWKFARREVHSLLPAPANTEPQTTR
jgi:uncharacterized protein (TIGR02246 family)